MVVASRSAAGGTLVDPGKAVGGAGAEEVAIKDGATTPGPPDLRPIPTGPTARPAALAADTDAGEANDEANDAEVGGLLGL